MDFFSVIVLLVSLWEVRKKQIPWVRLPAVCNNNWPYFWEFFFFFWLVVIAIGLRDSSSFLVLFSEWKWILNLYSLYWFIQKIEWIHSTSSPLTTTSLKNLIRQFQPFFITLCICFVYGAIGYVFNFDLFKQEPLTHGRRFGGPFDDPMNFAHIYGMYCGLLAAFFLSSTKSMEFKSFYLPFWKKLKSGEILFFLTWILISLSVLLSLTRGAWIGVTMAFILISFLTHRKVGMFVLGGVSFLFVSLMIFWSSFRERFFQAFHPSENYDSERLVLWKTNWAMFLDHPWFGVGHGDYKNFLPEYFQQLGVPSDHFQSHAHNQYLQALSNTGIIGFLFYLFFIIAVLVLTLKFYQKTQNPLFLGSLAAQVSFHLGAFTECNFERSKVRLVYLFFVALTFSLISKYNLSLKAFLKSQTKEES